MSKNIIICSDGTGNTSIKDRGSNVFKLFEAVDLNGHKDDPDLKKQVTIYDDGVGSESMKFLKIVGGAFGWGLSRNIRQLYAELSRSYETGDDIYLFGFSRGAYTVRMLAGFILVFGLLKRQKNELEFQEFVNKAYSRYYRKYLYKEKDIKSFKEGEGKDKFHPVPIKFIGVWDTVDAVGLPFDEATDFMNLALRFRFNDNKLSDRVERACHALAMDDERRTFHPVLWDEQGEKDDRIEQVWFPGAHANVGGGYPKQGMSLVSLDWMMEKVGDTEGKNGIRFLEWKRDQYRELRNINDKLYNSRSGLAVYYRYKPRNIKGICKQYGTRPKIHDSAVERICQETEGYAPGNFPKDFEIAFTRANGSVPEDFKDYVKNALGNHDSLLNKHSRLANTRVCSYYGFLIFSILAIGSYVLGPEWYERISELSFLNIFLDFWNHLQSRFWILIGLLISAGVGLWARAEMKKKFTEFWYAIVKKLLINKQIIQNTDQK